MATTSRFGLHYQALTDAPDGAALGGTLAADVDAWLCRWYPVDNAAARAAITSPPEGFGVRQRDDGSLWIYTDLGTWAQWTTGTGGGGGGGTSAGIGLLVGEWSATSAQTFTTSGTEYPVAFATENRALSGVTKATKGVGHKFTCTAGTYWCSASVRFAAGSAGSRFIGLRTDDDNTQYWTAQAQGGPAAHTGQFSGPVVLGSTTSIYVVASQSSGGSLATQPTSGSQNPSGYVKFSLTRVG
jgi:hypothetical protein